MILIKGDCEEIRLGISADDTQILIDNIDIVFHVAASVRFDDSLTKAVLMNTRGTYYTVELAKQFPKLKVRDRKILSLYLVLTKVLIIQGLYSSTAAL